MVTYRMMPTRSGVVTTLSAIHMVMRVHMVCMVYVMMGCMVNRMMPTRDVSVTIRHMVTSCNMTIVYMVWSRMVTVVYVSWLS
jgi:hypothetical protein